MKKAIHLLFASYLCVFTGVAVASDDKMTVSPLNQGDAAPYDGVLFSKRAVARMIADREAVGARTMLEITRAINECRALSSKQKNDLTVEHATKLKSLELDIEGKQEYIDHLIENNRQLVENRPNVVVWAGMGAASGVVATALVIFVLNSASK